MRWVVLWLSCRVICGLGGEWLGQVGRGGGYGWVGPSIALYNKLSE